MTKNGNRGRKIRKNGPKTVRASRKSNLIKKIKQRLTTNWLFIGVQSLMCGFPRKPSGATGIDVT